MMLQVRLRGLALDQSGSPVVILEVDKSNKGFGIWIGPFEAESLAIAVSGKEFPRPLTYDLFSNAVQAAGGKFDKVVIHSVRDNVYFANLIIINSDGETVLLDARPSDCLVLAVKNSIPVYVEEKVYEESAISLEDLQQEENEKSEDPEAFKEFVSQFDIEDFKRYLQRKKRDQDEDSSS